MPNTQIAQQIEELSKLVSYDEPTYRKHPEYLGKLNRMTAKAMKTIVQNGHDNKRFRRDYDNGLATYVCSHCGAQAIITASQEHGKSEGGGEALNSICPQVFYKSVFCQK